MSIPQVSPPTAAYWAVASNKAVRFCGPGAPAFRRKVLASADPPCRFLSPHQAAALEAATHRLVPGLEAYEAHVVSYVDRLLWRLDCGLPIFATSTSPASRCSTGSRRRLHLGAAAAPRFHSVPEAAGVLRQLAVRSHHRCHIRSPATCKPLRRRAGRIHTVGATPLSRIRIPTRRTPSIPLVSTVSAS